MTVQYFDGGIEGADGEVSSLPSCDGPDGIRVDDLRVPKFVYDRFADIYVKFLSSGRLEGIVLPELIRFTPTCALAITLESTCYSIAAGDRRTCRRRALCTRAYLPVPLPL